MIELAQTETPFGPWPPGPDEERLYVIDPTSSNPCKVSYVGIPPCLWCDEPVDSPSMDGPLVCSACDMGNNRDGSKWSASDHHRLSEALKTKVLAIVLANERAADWDIPSWWTLAIFGNGTYTLTRVDGIRVSAYRGSMMIWGWCVDTGGEHFEDMYEDAFTEEAADGTIRHLPIMLEAAAQFPDPAEFLPEMDAHYPVEA